jgi:aryl-alcohol dehydrogenase-like predicted oxidoreductase
MNFGTQTSEAESFTIMDKAVELGINFFDTADVYGWEVAVGTTELIIGRWLSARPGVRENLVLATKVYGRMGDGPNDRGLSARHIVRACENSLRRMQTDWIDLYQMHHIDRSAAWEEIWQAMDLLLSSGKVLYVGSSNFAAWQLVQACENARRRGMLGLVSEQSKYSLASRTVELEVIPACREYRLGLLPWSPLGEGRLAGVSGSAKAGRRNLPRIRDEVAQRKPAFEAWEGLCAEIGEKPAAVAMAWLLGNPAVTAPIIGPRTLTQLTTSPIRALELKLGGEMLQRLDQIFPGPGGEAPEAYAW